eukprot:g7679.t1
MKTTIVALCLALACASVAQAGRLERQLLQFSPGANSASVEGVALCSVLNGKCGAGAYVTTQAINDAADSLAIALSAAIAQAKGDADAAAYSFAEAIARAYAKIISSYELYAYVIGEGKACAYTDSKGESYATAISTAIAAAFAESINDSAVAVGKCFAKAVVYAFIQIYQEADIDLCVGSYDYEYYYIKLETVGYVETVAAAFGIVLTAIKDNNAEVTAICAALGIADADVTTTAYNYDK